ncbi:MAG: hypothetical protein Q8P41_11480 [Pseudomonadota bacterium]|nr:hypothetical protein [Pseudomonadota bacterium]
MTRRDRIVTLLCVLALAVATVWMFATDLHLRPTETDDVLWVSRGAPSNPDWLHWLFGRAHFVGYRPLPALTFTLDWWLGGGFEPVVYHGTDVLLHLVAVVLLVPLFRALFPAAPPSSGLVAAVLFAAHPAVAQVVPWFSRRSYVLAAVGVSGALLLVLRGRPWLGALALAAGLLSNETGFVAAPVVLLAAWSSAVSPAPSLARRVRAVAPLFVVTAAVFLARWAIVGKVGGYSTYKGSLARSAGVVGEALHGVWAPDAAPALVTTAALVVLVPLALWHLLVGAGTAPGRLLALWTLGAAGLVAMTGTWFHRLAYPFAVPVVLLVTAGLVPGGLFPRSRLARLPSLALAAWILAQSPLWRGLPADDLRFRVRMDAALATMETRLAEVPERGEVFLVEPWFRRGDANPYWKGGGRWAAHVTSYWASFVVLGRDVKIRELAAVKSRERWRGRAPRVVGSTIVFPVGTDLYLWPSRRDAREVPTADLVVPLPAERRPDSRVLFVDPLPGGLVTPAPAPATSGR